MSALPVGAVHSKTFRNPPGPTRRIFAAPDNGSAVPAAREVAGNRPQGLSKGKYAYE